VSPNRDLTALANRLDAIRDPRSLPMLFRLFRKSISMKLGVDLSAKHVDIVRAAPLPTGTQGVVA
jgi:hypothetical protein